MGKRQPSPPPAPDPTAMANAQSQANQQTAQFQQRLNMVNSHGPDGSVRWEADPSAPGGYRQITSLSPGQQGLYDQGLATQLGALGIANGQLGNIQTALNSHLTAPGLQTSFGPTDFSADRQAVTDAVINQARSRLDPQWSIAEDRTRNRLSNQGLSQNSTAYQTQMGEFGRDRNDAYNQAIYSGIQQGANEQNMLFNQAAQQAAFGNSAQQQNFQNTAYAQNQPINQLSALLGMGQVSTPQGVGYSPTGVNGTDVLGAYGMNLAQQNANYQSRMQNYMSGMGGLFNLGSAAIMAYSDVRLKRDIRFVGKRWDGLSLYAFKYLWETAERIGVMAQDVLAKRPDAVRRVGDYMAVDYGALA